MLHLIFGCVVLNALTSARTRIRVTYPDIVVNSIDSIFWISYHYPEFDPLYRNQFHLMAYPDDEEIGHSLFCSNC